MATELKTLQVRDGKEWRSWLGKNRATSPGVWLVYYKDHTGIKSIPYENSVREALCFGWVDSLIKRLDDRRYARKFTPRKPASKWSQSNRKRWRELKAAGLLAPAGLAAAPTENTYAPLPAVPDLPAYIAQALRRNREAWSFFQELAPSHRRQYVRWIHFAKRQETREKRICEAIAMLQAKQKLGLK
jgi:uncharacterized protein YdeI (YjbR/CyaY-like superfamily)